jgi:predicted ArsR family transcriptional regulator
LLIDDPYTPRDSWDVVRAIDVPVTRARQAMTSLERAGWLARSHLDPGDGRPARFCYTMTPAGIAAARRQLAEMAAEYELMDAARAAGDSWQLIGARLGRRTAQATRQRYLALARVLALTTEEGGRS